MKRILLLIASLALASQAGAQNLASPGYRCTPGVTAPASFGVGACTGGGPCIGIWCPSSGPYANTLVFRNAAGADAPFPYCPAANPGDTCYWTGTAWALFPTSPIALTDAATITSNALKQPSAIFNITLTASGHTFANPTGLVAGGEYTYRVFQNSPGSFTASFAGNWRWTGGNTPPTLSTTTPTLPDYISCVSPDGTLLDCIFTSATVAGGGGGSGTVTSVGLASSNFFATSGSPVTTSGTLTQTTQRRTVTSSASLSATTDFIVEANCASACTLTLPTAPAGGTAYWIVDVSGAAGANNVTISGAQNINGSASYAINTNRGFVQVEYDTTATQWIITANTGSSGGGSIGGSIAANQVAYGSGSNTIQGSSNFTYNGTNFTVGSASAGQTTLTMDDGSSAGVSGANTCALRCNNTTHIFEQSLNTAAWSPIGAATKLSAAYAAGGTSADQTMSIAPGNGGGVSLEDDNLGITPAAAMTLINKTAAATGAGAQQFSPSLELDGRQWSGTADEFAGWRMDVEPISGSSYAGMLRFYSQVATGGWTSQVRITNQNPTNPGSPGIYGEQSTAFYLGRQGTPDLGMTSASVEIYNNVDFFPTQTMILGFIGRIPALVNSYLYGTQPQAVTAGGAMTINPMSGGIVRFNIQSATAVSSITVNAPTINATTYDGVTLTVAIVQPASGTPESVPTTWTGVSFAGGTFVNTNTLGKRDYVTLTYDSNTSKWYETARTLNLSN